MTTAKTFYTDQELTKRSTAQLIAIYNRLFNTNIWEDYFNPFEHRMEIWMTLWTEMRAQEVVALLTPEDYATEPYKAMKIAVNEQGMAAVWNTGETINNRKFTDATIALVRQLLAEGESVKFISETFGMPKNRVYRIGRGDVYSAEPKTVRPTFSAARAPKAKVVFVPRPSAFWTSVGL